MRVYTLFKKLNKSINTIIAIMVKKLMADLSEDVLEKAQQALDSGLKPALKWTNKQLDNTLKSLGNIGISFNPSQIQRMVSAKKQGKGLKLTMTKSQADKIKQGGGFGMLAGPLLAGVAGPLIKEGIKGIKSLSGRGMTDGPLAPSVTMYPLKKKISLGSGLFLGPPPTSGAGALDNMFPGFQEFHDDIVGIIQTGALAQGIKNGKGIKSSIKSGIPITQKAIGNIIKNLLPMAERVGTKVILDQINNKTVSATPTTGGGMILKYNGNQVKAGKGFIGNLVKGVAGMIPF